MPNVKDRIQVRRDSAAAWLEYDPILMNGEFGLETDTRLIKVGDGESHWTDLRYLNRIDEEYFEYDNDGKITFNDAFEDLIESFIQPLDEIPQLFITNTPQLAKEVANKQYVDQAIAAAGHLQRRVVSVLPAPANANPDIIYLIKTNNIYVEYMLIDNQMEQIGTGNTILPIATASEVGGVRASADIGVTQDGFMTINRVSTSALYVPDGDSFTIRSGNATY